MGVRRWLARRAVRASRVLVVECPGAWRDRVDAEHAVRARGWRLAESPASADVLLVVGEPGAELVEVVAGLWDAMPGPRARVDLAVGADPEPALDTAVASLLDTSAQAEDAGGRAQPDLGGDGTEHHGMDHEGMDHGGHEGMGHGSHEGMDHGDMEMAPDGIPLAGGTEDDRDGLEMDALPVRLGPVLPHWPAGLVLDVTLHGDLVTGGAARFLGAGAEDLPAAPDPAVLAARHCDDVVAVLALAGWDGGAALARAARDTLLERHGGDARDTLLDLRYRVARSRTLRWSLGGVGVVSAPLAARHGLPERAVGDCHDRVLALVDRTIATARVYGGLGSATPVDPADVDDAAGVPVQALGPLVTGYDLAVARLVVASLGTPLTPAEVGAHG
ncbi:hypothetical protein [uncultured Phycicoccus sp.]|uniref:hypothetical protein n=1 Tax=uncultured Phycicoccus sp. TaxID=661422 RepID=UPI00261E44EE|nr:hypothetical protein [uncultured Phycicoccus sp.]